MVNQGNNLIKKLIITFVVYSVALLFIGRHLTFLPTISLSGNNNEAEEVVVSPINRDVIGKFLAEEDGTYSIYYKDLNSGDEFGVDENKVLTAASLNKLVIASLLYKFAEEEKVDLEDKITVTSSDIEDYGTGSIRYQEMPRVYSIKQLVKLMLEESDNTAARVLTVYLGEDFLQNYSNELGLAATNIINNTTSARDMGVLLEEIYKGRVTSGSLTLEMLDFMKDTLFEDRLARNFDDNIIVYHKSADAITMIHDAGIIDDGNNPFILVIMTTDMVDNEHAKEKIGALAEYIYEQRN